MEVPEGSTDTLRVEIDYPKPLPSFELDLLIDAENGFSASEKLALQNSWRLLKRRRQQHATTIFVDFFTKNDTYVDYFRSPSGNLNLEMLKQHPLAMLRFIGRLIEEGLPSTEGLFMVLLTEMVGKHRQHNVTIEAVELLTWAVRDHVLETLRSQSSPTFNEALDKLCRAIIDAHKEEPVAAEQAD